MPKNIMKQIEDAVKAGDTELALSLMAKIKTSTKAGKPTKNPKTKSKSPAKKTAKSSDPLEEIDQPPQSGEIYNFTMNPIDRLNDFAARDKSGQKAAGFAPVEPVKIDVVHEIGDEHPSLKKMDKKSLKAPRAMPPRPPVQNRTLECDRCGRPQTVSENAVVKLSFGSGEGASDFVCDRCLKR
jgi:hypothetical protein